MTATVWDDWALTNIKRSPSRLITIGSKRASAHATTPPGGAVRVGAVSIVSNIAVGADVGATFEHPATAAMSTTAANLMQSSWLSQRR
jgi:hypothetical protein